MNSPLDRQTLIPTPGARVVVRDAEWIVRRVDHAPGGYQIVCDGVSELVRGREAFFLTALEPAIEVLDPAKTQLVPDDSTQFTDSILYMESQLRQAVPNDAEIHVGHTAAMDLVPYQLDPARLALARPRQRILIADAVGLGKTLEAGILVSELIARGRGRRILVLAVKSMLTQFQKEFWNRFTIPLTRLDSIGIQRVRSRIPTNYNPFYYYDKAIISIDTLKQDAEYRTYLEQARWDIIVIDEEEKFTGRAIASGESAADFEGRLDGHLTAEPSEGEGLLAMFLQPDGGEPETPPATTPPPPLSLFRSELDYCEAALHRLQARQGHSNGEDSPTAESVRLRFRVDADSETLTLDAPDDLAARYGYLPPEVLPDSRRFILTTSRRRMSEAIVESRRAEATWPSVHYLWRLSPVVGWLNDRVLAAFGRAEAPILSGVPGLGRDEVAFVFSGLVPNQKSHPLVYEWIAVSFRDEGEVELNPFEALVERTGLGHRALPNRQHPADVPTLSKLLPRAVSLARDHFIQRRDAFEDIINAKLEDEVRALDEFKARRLSQLELDLDLFERADRFRQNRGEQSRQEVNEIHDEYLNWIEETMTTEPHPWIRVVCAMTPLTA